VTSSPSFFIFKELVTKLRKTHTQTKKKHNVALNCQSTSANHVAQKMVISCSFGKWRKKYFNDAMNVIF